MKPHTKSAAAALLMLVYAGVVLAQNEGIGSAGSRVSNGARGPVNLPTLGLSVSPPDETSWSVEPRDIGGGRWADVLTGRRDGSAVTFTATPAGPSLDCRTVMNTASQNSGSRIVSNALYAPGSSGTPVVEMATGVALLCHTVNGQAALFSVTPGGLTTTQQLAVRAMITAIVSSTGGGGLTLPPGSAEYLFTAGLRLSETGLTVPVQPLNGWSASVYAGNSGSRLDQISAMGPSGNRLSVTLTRLTGMTCTAALSLFVSSDTRNLESPAYLASNWFPRVVANSGGSFACLPLASGVVMATLTPMATAADESKVRVLLIGIRLAAYSAWGAGS